MTPSNERLIRLVERVRQQLDEIDACTAIADELFAELPLRPDRHHRRRLRHVAHFIGRAAELTAATIDEMESELSKALKQRTDEEHE